VEANALTTAPLDFIDTAGASYDEATDPDGESRLNVLEAELVLRKVQALLEAGLPPTDLAVIAPYAAQVRLLRERSEAAKLPAIEIDTVDGFQGREKEAVVVSLVRSNSEGEIGFLEDVRRMNVALTRARRKLIVIGDSATVGNHPFYQRLIDYFEAVGAYHSVWEEL
jgi:superfamily I DNA and/or RNA helicase